MKPTDYSNPALIAPVQQNAQVIRENLGMYIGGNGPSALYNVLEQLIQELLQRTACDQLHITRFQDGSWQIEAAGWLFAELNHPLDVGIQQLVRYQPGTFHMAVTNALASRCVVDCFTGTQHYRQLFHCGEPVGGVELIEPTARLGWRLHVRFDQTLFVMDPAAFAIFPLLGRLRELVAMIPRAVIDIRDEQSGRRERISYPNGLVDYFTELIQWSWQDPLLIPLVLASDTGYAVNLVLNLGFNPLNIQRSFANRAATPGGGTHVAGLWAGLLQVLDQHARDHHLWNQRDDLPSLTLTRLKPYCSYILAVDAPTLTWAGAIRHELTNPEIHTIVRDLVAAALPAKLIEPAVRYTINQLLESMIRSAIDEDESTDACELP